MKNKDILFDENLLIDIFIKADDVCKTIEKELLSKILASKDHEFHYKKPRCKMLESEIMTLLIFYHYSGFKCFEYFYKQFVMNELTSYFPKLLSYNRFVEILSSVALPMFIFAKSLCSESLHTGISFIDSKKLVVCHNRRIHQHKVFAGRASRGKSSTGWFFGFKIHLLINEKGELLDFDITPGNVADNNHGLLKRILNKIKGLCFGDKGYATTLWKEFYENGLKIITKIKGKTKSKLMTLQERYMLLKRPIIESVNDIFTSVFDLEHSRHRNPNNALTHMISCVCAYCFYPDKPSVNFPNWIN